MLKNLSKTIVYRFLQRVFYHLSPKIRSNVEGFWNQKSSCNWKRWLLHCGVKRFFFITGYVGKNECQSFFSVTHSFRRENYFSLGIPLRVLAFTSTFDSFHNTHFRLFFGCFTAKHFISYHWKAIRRYSIWRSEGLATSYIAVKLDYRMWQLPVIHAKKLRIKKKSFSSTRTFPTTLTSQVIYSYPETKYF